MKGQHIPLMWLLVISLLISYTDQNVRKKRQILPQQPRIITENGHLIFQSGINHNITFRSGSGGGIFLNNVDLLNAANQSITNKQMIDRLQSSIGTNSGNINNRISALEGSVSSLNQLPGQMATLSQSLNNHISQAAASETSQGVINTLQQQLTNLLSRVQNLERVNLRQDPSVLFRQLHQTVQTLETDVANLRNLLTTNECLSNPCRNGGTCVDVYNGFICRCTPYWQGTMCDEDVNECVVNAGTDMACQNGATCRNTPGSFSCVCTANWYGIHCREQHNDCTGASHAELCGHGTCVNEDRRIPGQPNYRCICESGWRKDSFGPACNTDVDECATGTHCSVDPLVQCINIAGSFTCGLCPAGYTGNGYYCTDVNECAINNGGCSTSPRVDCFNTRGSRQCGPCPPGYQGDGVSCTFVGTCNNNNGGCHPLATCIDDTGGFGRNCRCPDGYIGSGFGPNGCMTPAQAGACASNPCLNGASCAPRGTNGYICNCPQGFTGPRCNTTINACASNPCQNGGTCTTQGTGYTCQCTTDYTGTNCDQAQEECGGYRRGQTGSFRYPRTTGVTYPHRVNCAWVIITDPDKILRVTFPTFSIEPHPECNFDFLQIHDGSTASAHMIGKYCGTNPPNGGSINSTHNSLYFWFNTDASMTSDGFEVQWTSHPPVCGGNLVGSDHGTINSPGYPGNYPPNRDCVWTVAVSPGSNILFTFAHLALEAHENCSYDFLEIRDGGNENARLLARFCISVSPAPIYTTGPYAYVHFHSDSGLSDRGFHITYAALSENRQGCGGNLNDEEGEFTSPGYPVTYHDNAQCVWVITVAAGSTITLTFSDFDVETSSSCIYDSVTIRDGGDENAPSLGLFCGTNVPAPISSSGNVMLVEFRTDGSSAGRGFKARWTTGCGGTFTRTSGQIQSPNFPQPYHHNKVCNYLIEAPAGSTVLLSFSAFNVEQSVDNICQYDYVTIHDGSNVNAPPIGPSLCGDNIPADVRSTGSSMYIRFTTDGSEATTGFQATYSAVEGVVGCGGVLNSNTGVIQSPRNGNEYPHGINCTWYVTASPGFVIRLQFHMFSFERPRINGQCQYDFLEVYDNSTMYRESRIGKYCGSSVPRDITTSSNVMVVYMETDESIAREGFSATFTGLNVSTLCGSDLTDPTGIITSPNYPGNYPHDRQCEWTISVSDGNQIRLNITDMDLEQHVNCNYDYLEIRNGGYPSSPLIGKYCGRSLLDMRPILSHSNKVFLKFVSDHSSAGRGFRIEYDGGNSGCGGDLTTPTGAIISPNYPQAYSHNAECYWTITVSKGSGITLVFVDLATERGTNCPYDYIEIREDGPSGKKLGRFCGSTVPSPIFSSSNRVWIKYSSDGSMSDRGFWINYYLNCHLSLTGNMGVIESPNFPDPYHHDANCTWVINVPLGNKINVTFAAFRLESHYDCRYDRLEVRNGGTSASPVLQTLCGTQIPDSFQSSSNSLWLNFLSDLSVAHDGFRLEWIVDGCGGNLQDSTGTFTSPDYPNQYPHIRECEWLITVPTGMSINLNISDFDLEFHRDCDFDVLEVYSGSDRQGPLISRLCHTQTQPQVLHSTGNNMLVRLKTDMSISGRGFSATYTAVTGGCGGNFTANSATIMSINYPNKYEHNTECEWLITVADGHSVELTFNDFEVEGMDCIYDYVNLYDGPNTNATLLASLCGRTLPSPSVFRSNGSQMYIRMRTDSSGNYKGFSATYSTGCGGTLNADVDGAIISPNYPNKYRGATQCVWHIVSQHSNRRVTLTFTRMDIPGDGCENDFVAVRDGLNPLDLPPGELPNKFCGQSIPAAITSYGSTLSVVFQSGNFTSGGHFRAVYSSASNACGGDPEGESGRFTSPRYPDNYPVDTECVWQIRPIPGCFIQLSFPVFQLYSLGGVNDDYVEIRTPDVNGELVGRWVDTPFNLTALSGAWVKFRSNEAHSDRGFVAEWSTVYGGTLTGDSGEIVSPRVSPILKVKWTIMVSQNKRVAINFMEFWLRSFFDLCVPDHLKIYDGSEESGTLVATLCNVNLPPTVYTTTNVATLVYVNTIARPNNRFRLNWTAVAPEDITTPPPTPTVPGCGGDLIATEAAQVLTSPGYPNGYSDNLACTWTISVPEGNTVVINITDMNLERHGACNYDYVSLYDGNPALWGSRLLGKFCGQFHSSTSSSTYVQSTGSTLTVKFTTDMSVNRTGFALTYEQGCGGTMSSPAGLIKSLGYPNNYPANQNCTWLVTVRIGKTIRLNFENQFNIADSGSCNNDFLMLANGQSSNSPPLFLNGSTTNTNGRYCGTSAPRGLETSSNYLHASFVTDGSGTGQGFSFNYSETSLACGGHVRLTYTMTSGYIMSPNYPQNYPQNVDCIWIIMAPASERVRVDFEGVFNIEVHRNCMFDNVEFFDGGTPYSPRIGEPHCGNTAPSTVRSTENVMYVRFITDSSITHEGFKARYALDTCGGTTTGANGVITSPNYPANYMSNADCEWVVRGPVGHYLTFNITNIDLQYSINCTADVLEIRDGNSTGSVLLRTCRGPPVSVETSDNLAYIRFKSDASNVRTGFRITFQASVEECGGMLTASSGVITSPNYPGQYAHRRMCVWNIVVAEDRRITLTFEDFLLEDDTRRICRWDQLIVRNGIIPTSPSLGRFCGSTLPPPVESSGNTMQIQFRSDESVSHSGFRATYTSDKEAVCGGYITESPGNITSPGFNDGNYTNNLQCVWRLHNNRAMNSSIHLRFSLLRLEFHANCVYDFLEIREGSDYNSPLVNRFCGNETSADLILPTTDVWMRFRTDVSIAHDGFQLMHNFTSCGGIHSSPQGVITSPNYPNNYTHNDACAWKISAPEGTRIRITFTDFSVENHTQCLYDYLDIQNGGLPDSPKIGRYCGINPPPSQFVSQSNEIRISFITDFSESAKGFRLVYSFESEGCGGLYHRNQGQLSSPNHPSSYPHNVECRWDINVDPGNVVKLVFIPPFDLEAVDCRYDYVEVFDALHNKTLVNLGRWCSNVNPPNLKSTSSRMVVVFRSDFNTNGNGFSANWTAECGGIFTANSGQLVSPGYPQRYAGNLNCNYTISPGPGKHIALMFYDFELEGGRCIHDYLQIWQYNDTNLSLGRLCGTRMPDRIVAVDQMYLRFKTDNSLNFKGFSARYYAEECGGIFTDSTGNIASPIHPENYQQNMNCSWSITVDPDKIVVLEFHSFDIEPHPSCNYDNLIIYDGPDANSNMIGKFCGDGSTIPNPIRSTGNQMYITFISDASVTGRGFSAGYWSSYGPARGCGGVLRQSSGHISMNTDAVGGYSYEMHCEWLIYVEANKVVSFNVTGLHTWAPSEHYCRFASLVKVYDGPTKDDPLLSEFCSTTGSVNASSNVVMVKGSGFNATFGQVNAVCGGGINATSDPQTLTSPNYPRPAGQPVRCTWTIDSGSNNLQVRLTIQDIQLQASSSCVDEYLLFRDKPMGTAGKERHYCGTTIPAPFDSLGQQVQIIYQLRQNTASRGFQLTYQVADCNKNFSMSSGEITSPGYPGAYPRNADCTFRVTTPEHTTLALYFKVFYIEPHLDCNFDYLEVLNSSQSTVAKLCGPTIPSPIFLNDNSAVLRFKTDSSIQHPGFDITYVASTQGSGCGGNITDVFHGVITSPNYPGNFSDAKVCSWYITPPARHIFIFGISIITIEDDQSICDRNYLALYQGTSTASPQLGRFCAGSRHLMSPEPVLVQYVSSGVGAAPVFKLLFDVMGF